MSFCSVAFQLFLCSALAVTARYDAMQLIGMCLVIVCTLHVLVTIRTQ